MFKRTLLVLSVLSILAISHRADAQEAQRESSLGVGVQGLLAQGILNLGGPSLVFQTPAFHIEGILAFSDVGPDTDFLLAGRFWFAVAQTASSDFSVGGGLGLLVDDDAGMDSDLDVEIDLGAQLRAFIVPNVALSATLGFVVLAGEGDDLLAITAGLMGNFGIHYFF